MNKNQYDLLALMPCPLKVPFDRKMTEYITKKKQEGVTFKCNIEANVNQQETLPNKKIFKYLREAKTIDDLPEIILTTGLNSLFFEEFKKRFMGKGYFEEVLEAHHNYYSEYAYRDPNKEYTMFTLNPLVMVVNLDKLGKREVPTSWEGLIHPVFEKDVVIRGNDTMYCETVVLSLYRELGASGMEQLSKNINQVLHPAEMVKQIMIKREEAAAIYVMPYFFALKLRNHPKVKIVWPDEGALVNPISMLVKKGAKEEVKAMARYIVGEEMGQIFSDAAFPVVNEKVQNTKCEGKKLKWIGWDFINKEQVGEIIRGLNNYFLKGGDLSDL